MSITRNLINTKSLILPTFLAVVLIAASQSNFLLFHSLAEFFAIIVATLIAVVAWQMYTFTRSHFLMYLGCGYLWVAALNMLHTLTYENMSIFQVTGTNIAVQFWIATRLLEALLLLTAPWFLTRSVKPKLATAIFAGISISFTILIISGNFPTGFIEEKGLTHFKVYSEYLVIAILAGAMFYLNLQKKLIDQRVFKLIIASIALTMMAELTLTFYASVYEAPIIIGHILKFFSYWLIFIAVVRTTLHEPFSAMSKAETHYDAMPDAVIIVNNEGIIQHANKAACRLSRQSNIALAGKHAHNIFHNANLESHDCQVCQCVTKRKELSTYELKFNNTTWFDISISPIDDDNNLIQVIRNITEKRKTATALKQSEMLLRTVIESLPDLIWLKDPEGVYLSCNLKIEQLFGVKENEILGRTDYDFFDKELADFFRNKDQLAMAAGKPTINEEEVTYANDGHREYLETIKTPILDNDGKLIGILGIARDISERKKMETALQENEYNLLKAQKIAKIGNWKLNPDTGEVEGSKELLNIFEIGNDEMTLNNFANVIHPDDREKTLNFVENCIENGSSWIDEYRLRLKDGSLKWLQAIGEPVLNNEGKTTSIIGIVQDITARKLSDETIRRTQKMDALGKLTGGIAHDYNNMLGVIQGYAELLESMLSDEPKLAKYAHEIYQAGGRGAKLTKKLLAFSQQKSSSNEMIDLNNQLKDAQHMLEKTLTARIKLKLDLTDNLWPIWLDGDDLLDAIINMCINAMHAINGNGQLTIQTLNESIDTITAHELQLAPGDYVVFSITDTGCGMDETTRDRIFEPFYSTKGNLGTGLGLSQVYGFIERSNGAIKVYSEPGQGTQFKLYFTRHLAHDSISITGPIAASPSYRGNETILLVDDEPALLSLTSEILRGQGYHVICAERAKKALEILEKEPVDVLLSDVIMPDMDGYQLANIVREKYPAIKIQLASGFTDDRHNNMTNNSLCQNMLHKPYVSKKLLKQIRTLLNNDGNITLFSRTILVMDDEDEVRELFEFNLTKLGYKSILTHNGDTTIEHYQQSLKTDSPISAVILDISIPGSISGDRVAKKIRALNPDAKIIVASGDSNSPEMTNWQEYGFDAAIEKNFDRQILKDVLDQLLLPLKVD
ncbi:MAG: PAS domain S-box protein [Gammaproteobacteria bacterium]|nr:PAS domain S-box protein [Gammaproteobacteria bacterium]